jgi:hypothetical protein
MGPKHDLWEGRCQMKLKEGNILNIRVSKHDVSQGMGKIQPKVGNILHMGGLGHERWQGNPIPYLGE